MKQFQFPRSRIVSPEQRQDVCDSLAVKPHYLPCHDEQRLQEFQALFERSVMQRHVIRIISVAGNKKQVTTGIVRKADPVSQQLFLQTLEGERTIPVAQILEIS